MEWCNNANAEKVFPRQRLCRCVPPDALPNTPLRKLFMLFSDQSHLHGQGAVLVEHRLPVSIPIGQTLELGADLDSCVCVCMYVCVCVCIYFNSEETCLGFGLRVSYSVKSFQTRPGCGEQPWHLEQLQRDTLWDPAKHHTHMLLSWVPTRHHHHTLPGTSTFH